MNGQERGIFNYGYDELIPIEPSFDSSIEEISIQNTNSLNSFDTSQDLNAEQTPPELHDSSMRKSRIKEKVDKAKSKYPQKAKSIKKVPVPDKRQKQLVRNRLSAQKSRERKKQELQDLRQTNEVLAKSKYEVEEQLALVTEELEMMKTAVDLLSSESRDEFNRIRDSLTQEHSWSGKSPRHRTPLLLAGALLGCICLVGVISAVSFADHSAQGRLLVAPAAEVATQPAVIELQYGCWKKLRKCREEFIVENVNMMRPLPGSAESEQLTLYEEKESRILLDVDEMVDTLYTDNAYFLSSIDNSISGFENTVKNIIESNRKAKYLHIIIPEKNIKFIMPNGNIGKSDVNSNQILQMGCKVFDINRISSFTFS